MTELKAFTFDYEDNTSPTLCEVRIVERDGNPWFVGKDVAEALGYVNSRDAIKKHCKRASILKSSVSLPLVNIPSRGLTIIPESDVYRLIMKSKLPWAEQFEEWVMEDVLPTIRKTGGTYMTDDALAKTLEDPDYMIGVLQKMKQIKLERDEAIRTKAHISRKREASAMGTASAAKREANRLKEKYENPEFMTSTAIPWLKQVFSSAGSNHVQLMIGMHLKEISDKYDLPYHKIPGTRYPITQWHRDAVTIFKSHADLNTLRPKLAVYLKINQ